MLMRLFSFLSLFFCLLFSSCSEKKPELHLFIWSNYIKPELITLFESRYGCRVVLDFYDSNEAMYAKLKAGSDGYDLIFPSNYILEMMQQQQMLEDIDFRKIPNLINLDTSLMRDLLGDTSSLAIPYMLSFTGVGIRKDRLGRQPYSWNIFSRSDLAGRMTMLGDLREVIGAGLKFLGYSLNTTNEKELEEAGKLIISWKNNLAKFENEQYVNGLATAEFLAVQGYSGQLLKLMTEDEGVEFFLPQEGVPVSCDYIAIPKGVQEKELAHRFINFLYEPEVAAENIAYTLYLSPNYAAYPLLPEYLRKNRNIFPSEDLLRKSEVIRELGNDLQLYVELWDKIRAS